MCNSTIGFGSILNPVYTTKTFSLVWMQSTVTSLVFPLSKLVFLILVCMIQRMINASLMNAPMMIVVSLQNTPSQMKCKIVDCKEAKWFKWQQVNRRLSKFEERGNVLELYDNICTIAPKFLRHCHTKRLQAKQYELLQRRRKGREREKRGRERRKESKIGVLQMDFAENY